ncbi:hypothetical protein FOA43_000272 [Brettanomyces nanus]|uniref:N-acetyltransferase domain-containing protein n=1 Tax=Eeniella nana TaxID=13502 RepID=A0A875RWR9_EENNA|nr:uncharacterized protein FOA43_000272 [Brettanomyces nanus]QPG72968.1 hypothetical protein FOA43_000272 [Brettanomyces nanus]
MTSKITETIHDKLPDGTDVTILPYNSVDEASEELVQSLQDLMNEVIEEGTTYVQDQTFDRQGFLNYYFSYFVAVMVEGNVRDAQALDMSKNRLLGCFYIKPNYVGRSAHICNAGFLVPLNLRGRKIGKTMGKNYIKIASRLGYKYSVFNLVYATNVASLKIWDDLGFQRIGRIPNAGQMKGQGYVDAIMFGYNSDTDSATESDADFDSNYDLDMPNSCLFSSQLEKNERSNIMSLVVLITSNQINKKTGSTSKNLCNFLTDMVRRSHISLDQYMTNLVIMQRLFANDDTADCQFFNDTRKLILYSFMLGSTTSSNIDFDHWCEVTGLSKSQLASELVELGHALGGLHTIKTVSLEDLQVMKDSLKSEVKKYVKVI